MFSPKKLKEKRIELGFSQAEIARKLNISRMSFSAWESGKTKPNQKNLSILADIFDVEESFLNLNILSFKTIFYSQMKIN